MSEIYTIGYSGFDIESFISTLKKYNINSLIDVRSNPHSKIYLDYNKEVLKKVLSKNKIYYKNYVREFGARQLDTQYYTNGYLNFTLFTQSEQFREGIKKILDSIPLGYSFVLMCSEKDPIFCHRNIMVAREFYKNGVEIKNILSDGSILTQQEIEKRLVDMYFPNRNQLSFFETPLSWNEMVRQAYKFQNEKIGYRPNAEEDFGDE